MFRVKQGVGDSECGRVKTFSRRAICRFVVSHEAKVVLVMVDSL